MIAWLVILMVLAAAAYLLRPLFDGRAGRGGRRDHLLLIAVLTAFAQVPEPAQAVPAQGGSSDLSVGLLLIAVDAQRDHLRVSEALRVVNAGRPREVDYAISLPRGAVYPTVHRGLEAARGAGGEVSGRVRLGRGVREVIYSYALPAGRTHVLARAFPLRVARLEIVVRGGGVSLKASRGRALEAMQVGGARLPRWEVRDLDAGEKLVVTLDGLPVSRRWWPAAAAGSFAVLLAAGLAAAAMMRLPRAQGEVEESPPVRRN